MDNNNTPTEPSTPVEAAARLTELKANSEWSKAFLSGSGSHMQEFQKLQELASKADRIDLQIAGQREDKVFQDRDHVDGMETAKLLRQHGVTENEIARDVLSDAPVSKAEHDAAAVAKAKLMKDQEFVRRYLSGDGEAGRQMALLNVVLTRDIKEKSA